jgi:hypothetical protein
MALLPSDANGQRSLRFVSARKKRVDQSGLSAGSDGMLEFMARFDPRKYARCKSCARVSRSSAISSTAKADWCRSRRRRQNGPSTFPGPWP